MSAAAKPGHVGRKPKKKVFAKEGLTAVSAEIGSKTNESLSPVPRLPSSLNNERAASETQEREEGVHWGVVEGKEVARELDSLICFYRSDIWIFRRSSEGSDARGCGQCKEEDGAHES